MDGEENDKQEGDERDTPAHWRMQVFSRTCVETDAYGAEPLPEGLGEAMRTPMPTRFFTTSSPVTFV